MNSNSHLPPPTPNPAIWLLKRLKDEGCRVFEGRMSSIKREGKEIVYRQWLSFVECVLCARDHCQAFYMNYEGNFPTVNEVQVLFLSPFYI